MNSRADYCGQRNDLTANNILADGGAHVDRGNAAGHERDVVPRHRGRARADAKDSVATGTNSEVRELAGNAPPAPGDCSGSEIGAAGAATDLARIPQGVRASVASKPGEYDARRLRSQREIIRDVMLSAADCETWLTLGELRALTRYGEASISAQLRHLRKTENGGYDVTKRHREGASPDRPGTDGRGECIWEYRITRGMCVDRAGSEARLEAVGA
jgi:hypothetical protein